jgi:RimJ/RimL family protein N-acetyltransferase
MTPTLSVVCEEREGEVRREVSPFIFTPESTRKLYSVASQFPVLFGKPLNSIEDFLIRFFWYTDDGLPHLRGPVWVVDDFVGIFYLTDLKEDEATAHFAFFDKKFWGRHKLVKAMVRHTFQSYGYRRLNVVIPSYAGKKVFKFVSDLGFTLEGRKREDAFYKGSWFDSNLYGILRSEVLKDGS